MKFNFPEVDPALYIVSIPIGTISDISYRALNVLSKAKIILVEDTRKAKKLFNLCHIDFKNKNFLKYNDHEIKIENKRRLVIEEIKKGQVIVLISDAGTPLIADPGYKLVKKAVEEKCKVVSVPGPCALISALVVSGLPTNSFFFSGFVPKKKIDKEKFFENLKSLETTLIFYETPKRIKKTLIEMSKVFGLSKNVVICKELTKKFEEIERGSLRDLVFFFSDLINIKGEYVILLENNNKREITDKEIIDELLIELGSKSMKSSVSLIAKKLEVSRKKVYDIALKLKKK